MVYWHWQQKQPPRQTLEVSVRSRSSASLLAVNKICQDKGPTGPHLPHPLLMMTLSTFFLLHSHCKEKASEWGLFSWTCMLVRCNTSAPKKNKNWNEYHSLTSSRLHGFKQKLRKNATWSTFFLFFTSIETKEKGKGFPLDGTGFSLKENICMNTLDTKVQSGGPPGKKNRKFIKNAKSSTKILRGNWEKKTNRGRVAYSVCYAGDFKEIREWKKENKGRIWGEGEYEKKRKEVQLRERERGKKEKRMRESYVCWWC